MGLYLLLAIVMTLYHFRRIHLKSTLIFLCIVAGIVVVSYKPLISPKIMQTQIEVDKYQKGYDRTSLGARFSMWTIGIQNGLAHPLGQSVEERETWTKNIFKMGIRISQRLSFTSKCIYTMNSLKSIHYKEYLAWQYCSFSSCR